MSESPQADELDQSTTATPRLSRLERAAGLSLWVYWPLLAVGTHWPNLKLSLGPSYPLDEVLQRDKIAHTIGFGGLMVLVLLSGLGKQRLSWTMRCAVSLAICMTYAVVDELSQVWTDGRLVSIADLVANVTAIIGVYLVARQPWEREHGGASRLIVWPMILVLPFLIYGMASPWVMSQAVQLKRSMYDSIVTPGTLEIGRLDYWTHGVIAFVVSVIVFVIWPAASHRPKRATAAALLVLILSGPAVEVMQHFTGRGVQAMDVLSHTIGVLLAMMGWAMWPWRRSSDAAPKPAPTEDIATAAPHSFVGHAVLVSLLTLLSRFAGLARDAILAAALGLSVAADAFFIGFLVPNLFRRLFGEGALTAAFIPNYTDLLERDPALAKRFATLTLTLLSVLLVGITLVGELALWWLASSIDPEHKATLAIQYTRVMLPYMPLICAVALIGGILQVHKRFGPPAAVPLVLNGVIVVSVLLSTGLFKRNTDPAIIATWVAVGVVIAGVLQLLSLIHI